jgi:hypothetical protein
VALTAGVAALWLAHHGRDALIERYGKGNLQRVFRRLLTSTARDPGGWDQGEYGAGIVDAEALLNAGLPDLSTVPALEGAIPAPMDRLAVYVPQATVGDVEAALDVLLSGVPRDERELYAGELAYLLAQDDTIRNGFAAMTAGHPRTAEDGQMAAAAARLTASASPSLVEGVGSAT